MIGQAVFPRRAEKLELVVMVSVAEKVPEGVEAAVLSRRSPGIGRAVSRRGAVKAGETQKAEESSIRVTIRYQAGGGIDGHIDDLGAVRQEVPARKVIALQGGSAGQGAREWQCNE